MIRASAPAAALAGIVAAALAIGLAELLAGLVPGLPSLVTAVGTAVIALQPPGAKDLAVALFGTNDKLALNLVVLVAALALGAAIGLAARADRRAGRAAVIALVAVGVVAAIAFDPLTSPLLAIVGGAIPAATGIAALEWLLGVATGTAEATEPDRRRFLAGAAVLGTGAVLTGLGGRSLLEARAADQDTATVTIPPPLEPAAPLPAGAELAVAGISPLVTANDDFYRIDTALLTPSVDLDEWRLTIRGIVDRETTLTFDELVDLPLIERYVTIACVSNEVGGSLVGNAKWTGVRLTDLLDIAGVQPGASQVVGRSVDGWTAGFPTEWVTAQERDAMVAVRMNDEPLPVAHGFPARLIVPGLYGYVSATKWLREIELTTLEAFDAYWVPLGWAKEGPILTQSRIDTPRNGATETAGRIAIAGVAWAPERGITRVEVQVDDDAWREATLGAAISDQTWVQWRFDWDAAPGEHRLRVRATDGTGEVQTAAPSPPAPDGARGHHQIFVSVG